MTHFMSLEEELANAFSRLSPINKGYVLAILRSMNFAQDCCYEDLTLGNNKVQRRVFKQFTTDE